jgi:hypothetical protein
MQISESTGRKILLTILIILVIGLIVLLWLISKQIKEAKQEVGRVEAVSATQTVSITPVNANINVTYSLVSDENADSAKDVANKFMLAKLERNYEQAKPYMTDELKAKLNQESFAGTSSPSMDRFEISSISKKDDNTYVASAISYWKLNGEDAETVKYNIEIIKKDSDYLVNRFD